jgi:hypothetical protein
VEKRGYIKLSLDRQHSATRVESATAGAVKADQIELRMIPASVVTGRIIDSRRQPVMGASVQLSRMYLQGNRTILSPVTRTSTDDMGMYRLFDLQPGRYYVSAFYQDQGSRLGLRESQDPSSKGSTEDYSVTFYPGELEAQDAAPVRTKPGQVLAGIDIQLRMNRSFRVAGVVTGLPANTTMAQVFLQPFQPGNLGPLRVCNPVPGSHSFEFSSVAPGAYLLRTEVRLGTEVFSARERIDVGAAPVNVELGLRPPFLVSGTVLADGPIPEGVQLRLHGLDTRFLGPIKPDINGRFEVPVLGPDSYAIDATDEKGMVYVKSAVLDNELIGVNGITIRDSRPALRLVLSGRAGRIEGKAVDAEKHAILNGLAVLVTAGQDAYRSYAAPLSEGGSFTFKSLPPGKYHIVCFSDLSSGTEATWDVQRKVSLIGAEIQVDEASKQQMVITSVQLDSQ